MPPIDRRALLTTGAGGALGAMALGLPVWVDAAPARPAAGVPQLLRYYKALRGGFVDRETFGGVSGIFYAELPDRTVPLFGFLGARLNRARIVGGTVETRGKESLVFCDLATGLPIDRWRNPWTGETCAVRHWFNGGSGSVKAAAEPAARTANDAFGGHSYRGAASAPGARAGADATIPFDLPWQRVGDRYLLARHWVFRNANPVNPARWPKASTGAMLDQQEFINFYLPAAALDDPAAQDFEMLSTLTRRSPWLPFMRMGGAGVAGGMLSVAHSYKITGTINDVPPALRAYLERVRPDQLEPYAGWTSTGSAGDLWEDYARSVPAENQS